MGKNFKGDNSGILLALCIIPLGMDKLYKESVLLFLLKLFSAITIVIFAVWWVMDIIMCATGKYETNPVYYFKKREAVPAGYEQGNKREKKEKAPKPVKEKKAKKADAAPGTAAPETVAPAEKAPEETAAESKTGE